MKKRGSLLLFMIALAAIGLIGYASIGYGAHPVQWPAGYEPAHNPGDPLTVTLKSAGGADIAVGSSTPYSPKQTCGVCHEYKGPWARHCSLYGESAIERRYLRVSLPAGKEHFLEFR